MKYSKGNVIFDSIIQLNKTIHFIYKLNNAKKQYVICIYPNRQFIQRKI